MITGATGGGGTGGATAGASGSVAASAGKIRDVVGVAFRLSIISLRSLFFSLQRDAQGRLDLLTVMLAGAACVNLDAAALLLSRGARRIDTLDEPALNSKSPGRVIRR